MTLSVFLHGIIIIKLFNNVLCCVSAAKMLPTEDELKHYKSLSLKMYDIMKGTGYTTKMRDTIKEMAIVREVLATIAYTPYFSVYSFGSLSEGTFTKGFNTDEVYVGNIPVVTDIVPSTRSELLLVSEEQPGYAKLQLISEGRLIFKDFGNVKTSPLHDFRVDKSNRVCLIQKAVNEEQFGLHKQGPAISHPRELLPSDTVFAFKCETWPECASEWLTRQREHDWPSLQT